MQRVEARPPARPARLGARWLEHRPLWRSPTLLVIAARLLWRPPYGQWPDTTLYSLPVAAHSWSSESLHGHGGRSAGMF